MLINPYTVNSKVLCFSSFLGYIFCRKFGSLFSVYVNGYSKLLAKTEKKRLVKAADMLNTPHKGAPVSFFKLEKIPINPLL